MDLKGFFSDKKYWTDLKEKLKDKFNEDRVVAYELKKNIKQVIKDIETGKIFDDDNSAENAKNTLLDLAKITGQTALFILPGGSAGVVALRKFLKTEKAKQYGLENLIKLSVDEKDFPLDPMPEIPKEGPGSFGAVRKYDVHTGIDLYCKPATKVKAIECGEVVAILDFTGTKADSPWWNDTRAVLIEGASGVFVYGEIKEREDLKIGDNVECGDVIGEVVTVLKKDKGLPMTMLHLELMQHKERDVLIWELNKQKPEQLLDPSTILNNIRK